MTTSSLLRILTLAAVVVAVPAGAQAPAARPAPPVITPRTLPPVQAQPRAVPPTPQPALPSAQQRPTPAVVLPARTVVVNDTTRIATQAAAPAAVVADVAPAAAQVAASPVAPLPVTNQPGPPPANATGRCKDGTYLIGSAATDANCSTRGGLGVAFPQASRPARVP